MLGLCLDVVGAFFLSVEAIKLDNLRALREKVFRTAYRHTLSPAITFTDSSEPALPADSIPPARGKGYIGIFMALHYVAGLLVLAISDRFLDGRLLAWAITFTMWLLEKPWHVAWPILVLTMLFTVVGGLWMLGELVHMSVTATARLPLRFLEFIDAKTPNGTVGVLGFLLLAAGFGLQMVGSYSAGPPGG